jgi:phosphate transport system protein
VTPLETKIAELQEQLFTMAGIVEEMVQNSIKALVNRDAGQVEPVTGTAEDRVNRLEKENEDAAINLIALYQPEASNLRTLVMVIKINNDLERIGDHAVNIAESASFLITRPPVKPLIHIPQMAEHTVAMLRDSLDAFGRKDAELARDVCGRDSIVDGLNAQVKDELKACMARDPETIERSLKLMMVSLNLERVADLATNIAEDVIYIVTGEDIKHGRGEPVA